MYKIIKKEILNPTVTRMVVEAPLVAKRALAGQFVILRADSRGERIPLTIAGCDREKGTVTIIFQVVGGATMCLNAKSEGEEIADLAGPLGVPTEVDGLKKVAVVGGGVGCAIALPVAKRLFELGAEVTSIVGFRSRDLVILEEEFKEISSRFVLMTDDGSCGEKGNVCIPLSRLLESGERFDAVIAIGPLVMMKFVAQATKPYHIKTIASMNPIMIDGTGMCGGCRVSVGGEMKFACVDGPDFDAHLIDFDEAIKRSKTYAEFEAQARERHCNLFKNSPKS
ncbi:MAG: sulfide/dihydroorotate dehydrogenase-like FAD/NAD-binding protein [Clostridia bacterium]|nr:sulfide/dihydroorotate dehydrogenase-like FAD/NAD-binding protein [Clostridia bacterium]